MTDLKSLAALAARILLSILFILSGFGKITAIAATQGYMASAGLPGVLVWPTILVELGGGLAILFGLQTRAVAVLLAGFSVLAALLFHFHPADQMQMVNFLKNLGLAGGFLLLAIQGAGALSLDSLISRRAPTAAA